MPHPEPNVTGWLDSADPESLFVSVVTFGEIRLGIEELPGCKRRTLLPIWFDQDLTEWFGPNQLPINESIADR